VRAEVKASAVETDVFASDNRGFYLSITLYTFISLYIYMASRWASEGSEVRAEVNASAVETDVFASDNRGFYLSIILYIFISLSLFIYIRRILAGRSRGPRCEPM